MGDPFREQGSQFAANQFATHVGIAEDQLAQCERIPEAVAAMKRGEQVDQGVMDAYAHAFRQRWGAVWEQLQQARELVARLGRDVTAYDAARASAGDVYLSADGSAVQGHREVTVRWANANTQSAHAAIAALRAAMPEVDIVQQAPLEVDLRSSGGVVLDNLKIAAGLCLVGGVIWILYLAFTG